MDRGMHRKGMEGLKRFVVLFVLGWEERCSIAVSLTKKEGQLAASQLL